MANDFDVVIRQLEQNPHEARLALDLVNAASESDRHPALSDPELIALRALASAAPEATEARSLVIAASSPGPDSALLAMVYLSRNGELWTLQIVVHPGHRDPEDRLEEILLRSAIGEIALDGGGPVQIWKPKVDPEFDVLASSMGMHPVRDLLQMRAKLPIEEVPENFTIRPFVPGEDEARWVEVNNRAFAGHPDQGNWTVDTMRIREQQPWFDPDGFLIHQVDGDLAGSCWTKIHSDLEVQLGEIYVISVDPRFHRLGIGRNLLLAGLHYMWKRGVEIGMLYVEAENTAAVSMYESVGFAVDHTDRAYGGSVPSLGID